MRRRLVALSGSRVEECSRYDRRGRRRRRNHCNGPGWYFLCNFDQLQGQFGKVNGQARRRSGLSCYFRLREAVQTACCGSFACKAVLSTPLVQLRQKQLPKLLLKLYQRDPNMFVPTNIISTASRNSFFSSAVWSRLFMLTLPIISNFSSFPISFLIERRNLLQQIPNSLPFSSWTKNPSPSPL
jgi:hypothetical protein